jgi:hypothetical protein
MDFAEPRSIPKFPAEAYGKRYSELGIYRLPAGAALLELVRREHHRLDLGAKALPRYETMASSGSPFADKASKRLSASKNPS